MTQNGGSKTYNFMLIDEEERYLYLGVRTNGISVYDLTFLYYYSSLVTPFLVQELNSDGLSNWISFSPSKNEERQKYEYLFFV